jgi:hypothetical protein
MQDSFSKLNLKLNSEINQKNNFNMYEKPNSEPENFMFYNQNQSYNKSPPSKMLTNFNNNTQSFQSTYINPTSPNINYFNNYQQNKNQNNNLVNPPNHLDYQGTDFPSNKMNFLDSNNQYSLQNSNNPCNPLFKSSFL